MHQHAAGAAPGRFFPEKAGKDYASRRILEVLKDLRDDFTVISGLSHPDVGPSHDSNFSFLTGGPAPGAAGRFRNSISLDQFAAEHIGGQTRFPSLPLSCEGFGLSWTRSGRWCRRTSGRRACSPSCSSRAGPTRSQAQARRLRGRPEHPRRGPRPGEEAAAGLGAGDREKLDEYFTSVRELEQRLAQAEEWAKKPKPKVDAKPPQNVAEPADLIGKTRLWFDLIHLALQTDSTRLVTLQLLGTSGVPPIPGVSLGHHDLSHHGKDPAKIAQLKTLEIEKMKTLRDFLDAS